uniref:Large ribosomal RNA subunit accumulation protein YceD n=1 Tax=Candidatus Kentrum sp. FW TaxID=2126338 RepID=A0A450SVF6_9GAMM|nr:MAG: uncharacterized protein BECKFW1821B_GA0114236_103812 [Candidatus Kentron sp. FW]
MPQDLPELIYPLRFARSERSLRGHVTLARMHRLRPLLAVDTDNVEVDLQFGQDDSGRFSIQGTIRADLSLICQRCLEVMLFQAKSDVRLALVSEDDRAAHLEKQISPGFEPLVVMDDEAISLSDLIEEELLLTLPVVPKHANDACGIPDRYQVTESMQHDRKKPFMALEGLMERVGKDKS